MSASGKDSFKGKHGGISVHFEMENLLTQGGFHDFIS